MSHSTAPMISRIRPRTITLPPQAASAPSGRWRKPDIVSDSCVPPQSASNLAPPQELGDQGGSALVLVRRRLPGGLARLHDDELAHEPLVLVAEQVAVEHVGGGRVGVVAEPGQEAHALAGRERNRVLPAGQGCCWSW